MFLYLASEKLNLLAPPEISGVCLLDLVDHGFHDLRQGELHGFRIFGIVEFELQVDLDRECFVAAFYVRRYGGQFINVIVGFRTRRKFDLVFEKINTGGEHSNAEYGQYPIDTVIVVVEFAKFDEVRFFLRLRLAIFAFQMLEHRLLGETVLGIVVAFLGNFYAEMLLTRDKLSRFVLRRCFVFPAGHTCPLGFAG